jgi:hypothetical protein
MKITKARKMHNSKYLDKILSELCLLNTFIYIKSLNEAVMIDKGTDEIK